MSWLLPRLGRGISIAEGPWEAEEREGPRTQLATVTAAWGPELGLLSKSAGTPKTAFVLGGMEGGGFKELC